MTDADIRRVNLDSDRNLTEPHERTATEAVNAGDIVIPDGNGDIALHATDGSRPGLFFVVQDARQRGMEWGDEYLSGTLVPLLRPEGGYLNLPLAAGESVTPDDHLVPNGSGKLRAAAGDGTESGAYIGIATEAVDNSGGSEPTAVPVEVFY